jgi:hypothetical protein
MHSTIVWLPWSGLGQTPAIVDDQGEVLRLPLLWFVKLAKEESSPSKLRDSALGLWRFQNFWQHYNGQFKVDHDLGPATEKYDLEELFRTFWRAMLNGDPNLAWSSIGLETAKAYFRSVNEFLDWTLDGTNAAHPNPIVETQLSWFGQAAAYVRRIKTDMLAHLVTTGSVWSLADLAGIPASHSAALAGRQGTHQRPPKPCGKHVPALSREA